MYLSKSQFVADELSPFERKEVASTKQDQKKMAPATSDTSRAHAFPSTRYKRELYSTNEKASNTQCSTKVGDKANTHDQDLSTTNASPG